MKFKFCPRTPDHGEQSMSVNPSSLNRRQLLLGTAAATTALGVTRVASATAAERRWDREADIVVVGSGVAACTAALTAHKNGDQVVMLEKAPFMGGTSMRSGGVFWVPNNFVLRAKGIKDDRTDCLHYFARFSYPERYAPEQPNLGLRPREFALLEAFYDNASRAMDDLRDMQALNMREWRGFMDNVDPADYLDHVPENKLPTGRTLGPMRPDGGIGASGGDVVAQLGSALKKRSIPMLLEHRVVRAVLDADHSVVGVEAESGGKVVAVRARKGVIFATGGFVHNPEMTDLYMRQRLYGSCAMPAATGDFVRIGIAAGAKLGNMTGAWRTQVVLEQALASREMGLGVFYPPGDSMLQVNKYGVRAVNENRNYSDRTEVHGYFDPAQSEYPNQLMFMIYDARTAGRYGGSYPLPADPAEATSHVIQADSLDALHARLVARLQQIAAQTGRTRLDPSFLANLKATIAAFNGYARKGVDPDFHRGAANYDKTWNAIFSVPREGTQWGPNPHPNPTMHPLSDKGPYYCIILAAGALDTCGGPMIDASARILDEEERPIPGLYGAGNCIASPSRFAYWGAGYTLAAAMTFGYVAANSAHRDRAGAAAGERAGANA